MKRILFVDDEVQVLDGLRGALRRRRREWDMVFAVGGERALDELGAGPFDVIVTDMRMPGMDGAKLLEIVKAKFPSTIRIVLSGHAERDAALRALEVCHQFLGKPCDPDVLQGVLERALELHGLLADEALRRIVGEIQELPAVPRIYAELSAALEKQSCSAKDLAKIVETDPALSAKLLKIANSAFFGLAQKVSSPERAIAYLGMELVRGLVLTANVFSLQPTHPISGFSVEDVQAHSFLVAQVARTFVADGAAREQAFIAGLLHEAGELVLAVEHPDRFASVIRASAPGEVAQWTAERAEFGVSHAEIGAYLVGLWGLPTPVVQAIAHHHDAASPTTFGDIAVSVHAASLLVTEQVSLAKGDQRALRAVAESLDRLAAHSELSAWRVEARSEVEKWLGTAQGG